MFWPYCLRYITVHNLIVADAHNQSEMESDAIRDQRLSVKGSVWQKELNHSSSRHPTLDRVGQHDAEPVAPPATRGWAF